MKVMKVRMLQSTPGSPDGIEVRQYDAGGKYELPESLAQAFLDSGRAEEDKEDSLEVRNAPQFEDGADDRARKPGRSKKISAR